MTGPTSGGGHSQMGGGGGHHHRHHHQQQQHQHRHATQQMHHHSSGHSHHHHQHNIGHHPHSHHQQQQQHSHQAFSSGNQLLPQPRIEKHTVHWFRKDLRLHDNPAFVRGVRDSVTFRCVFIIDPWFAGAANVGVNKWRFLLQCLEDLDRNLKKLNSRLFVIRGQPADVLPKVFKKWATTCVSFEEDPEPFGRVRDQHIQKLCAEMGVQVITSGSNTLFQLEHIIERNGGTAPLTFHQFHGIVAQLDPPDQPEPNVSAELLATSRTPTSEDHDEKYGVPTMMELGFDVDTLAAPVWIGGETEALLRLDRHLERKAWVATFCKPKVTPQSVLASQTGISPYLRFGCLSTRLFYHQLYALYRRVKQAQPPLSLHGQLLWREFFFCSATRNQNFDRMERNEVCVQIPWHSDATALAKWSNGQTGFPWIDAIMVQLRSEGWIHHLARHAVVCFLTRGDLWISWVEGMKVFEELLLDADWSVNAGTWMWLSGSSFFQQFYHSYCPVKFGRKADPDGAFVRRYLPVLQQMPTRWVHEPWNAPEEVQRNASCVVGRDYPCPMVDHEVVSRTNRKRLAQVYSQLDKYRIVEGDSLSEQQHNRPLQSNKPSQSFNYGRSVEAISLDMHHTAGGTNEVGHSNQESSDYSLKDATTRRHDGDVAAQQELNQYLNEDTSGQTQLFDGCMSSFLQSDDAQGGTSNDGGIFDAQSSQCG